MPGHAAMIQLPCAGWGAVRRGAERALRLACERVDAVA